MLSRSTAEAFLVAYFSARRDPEAGQALWGMLAPTAALLVDGKPAAAATPSGYAASHRAAVTAQAAGDPAFPLDGALELASWEPEGERGVAWLRHDDPARGSSLWVACGLVAGPEGSPRLAWAALGDKPEGLDFAKGQALGLAEFPGLKAQGRRPNRDWLDVAYRRRHRAARPPLLFLEDARSSCQGSGDCCKMAWEVTVEPEAQALIDALPWETLAPHLVGTKLPANAAGELVLKGREETCRFLNEKYHCRIHAYLGTPVFATCSSYPYRFTETPDGIAVSASFQCGSVRGAFGAPLAAQASDLHDRMTVSGMLGVPAAWRLTPEREVDWPTFRDLEATLRAVIMDASRPMADRLWIASRVLEAHLAGEDADPARFAAEEPAPLDEGELAITSTYAGFLLNAISNLTPALAPLQGFAWEGAPLRDEAFVATWLETLHFSKEFSYHYDLVTAHTIGVVLYVVALALEQAHGGRIPEDVRARLGGLTGHRLLIQGLDFLFGLAPFMRDVVENPDAAKLFMRLYRPARAEARSC